MGPQARRSIPWSRDTFKDMNGQWWCTAFFNGNVPPASCDGIVSRNIGDNARTINEQGVTIVPLDVRVLDNGEVFIRAKILLMQPRTGRSPAVWVVENAFGKVIER